MTEHRIRRITADIDTKSFIKVAMCLLKALSLKPELLELKRSSRKGYHLIIWSRCNGKITDLRRFIGDDPKRLYMDTTHRYGRQTLFSKKKKLNMAKIRGMYER